MSDLIRQIHDTPHRGVWAVTGGGSSAISQLLAEPGASRTVLQAIVPYSQQSLHQWTGGRLDSACSEATARAMAMAACESARLLSNDADAADGLYFGVGATASLVSDRPKRGPHRVHVALQTVERTTVWSLELAKGSRTRREEEAVAAELILHATATACGLIYVGNLAAPERFTPHPNDHLTHRERQASPLWQSLIWGADEKALVDAATGEAADDSSRYDRVLFPGSFAPAHNGHQRMREFAARKLSKEVTLELSIENVSKPWIDYLSLDDRLQSIVALMPDAQVWLTCAPTFVEKARALPGATFVVGADTIARVGDPRYYFQSDPQDHSARDEAIEQLADLGCRFLVFGRQIGPKFETLETLSIPQAVRELCDGVPEAEFRQDVSSTQLRQEPEPEE